MLNYILNGGLLQLVSYGIIILFSWGPVFDCIDSQSILVAWLVWICAAFHLVAAMKTIMMYFSNLYDRFIESCGPVIMIGLLYYILLIIIINQNYFSSISYVKCEAWLIFVWCGLKLVRICYNFLKYYIA